MSTTIEWTDTTWNPVTGCTKVSAGCKNCYAERVAERFWKGRKFSDVRLHHERLDAPLRWRKPKRVFVNSMSDLFHEAVDENFIDTVFAVMHLAQKYGGHTFQILTKRPERMLRYMTAEGRAAAIDEALVAMAWPPNVGGFVMVRQTRHPDNWPPKNVWLGVSCENQGAADERIPLLLETPAAVRFLSCEPLLCPIDLEKYLHESHCLAPNDAGPCLCVPRDNQYAEVRVDWVIAGGESGAGARPCDVAWIRSIVEQCRGAGVACFVKQLGAKPAVHGAEADPRHPTFKALEFGLRDKKGGDPDEWPQDLRVRQFPGEELPE